MAVNNSFVIAVAGIALVGILANEWRRIRGSDIEKRDRWLQLPLRFKLGCWLIVTPLFCFAAAVPFVRPNWIGGIVTVTSTGLAWLAMAIVETRAVAWYRQNGLLPEREEDDAI